MNKTVVFEPVTEIEMLKLRIEQLERVVEEIRNPTMYGVVPKWCPQPNFGEPYYMNAPQANVVYQ